MGRPPKRNLNYSTWDVDVLENDTSIDNLIDAQGPAGFYVYFALCQKAYANPLVDIAGKTRGVPDDCDMLNVARSMGISLG